MKIRKFINQMCYYTTVESVKNYIIRCKDPESPITSEKKCVEIPGQEIKSALATRFEWHPNHGSTKVFRIPYEDIEEIRNVSSGRSFSFQ